MKPDRLLTLQRELYGILTESKGLKIDIEPPPWETASLQKAKSLAHYLSETEQSVVKDSTKLEAWLDKYSFFEQASLAYSKSTN